VPLLVVIKTSLMSAGSTVRKLKSLLSHAVPLICRTVADVCVLGEVASIRCLYGDCHVIGQVDVLIWNEGWLFNHHAGSVKAGIGVVKRVPLDTELA
jgi:hypothetical protein